MEASNRILIWIDGLSDFDDFMDRTTERSSGVPAKELSSADAEDLTTPRGVKTLSLNHIDPPPPFGSASSTPSMSSANSANSEAALNTSRDTKRKRKETGTRRSSSLNFAPYPIVPCSIGTVQNLPAGAQELARRMRECQLRIGILHPESRAAMQSFLDNDEGSGITERLFSHQRGRLGNAPCIDDISDVVRWANKHDAESAAEPAWNQDVHIRLLRLALKCSHWKDQLRCDNVTTASIDAGAFSSTTYYKRDPDQTTSRIDYSIGLELIPDVRPCLSQRVKSVNPTLYEPVRLSPTAIHIETKLTGEGWQSAKSQLCIWMTHHIAKLRELLALAKQPDNISLPVFPLLVIQGHSWTCLFFVDDGNGARVYSGLTFGSSQNELDAHAAIAGLHVLIHWAQTEYRPWFERTILEPLLKSPQSAHP